MERIESKEELKEIADRASISISIYDDTMIIQSKFILNRFNVGMLVWLACSIFVIWVSVVKTIDNTSLIMGLSLGIIVFVFSLLGIFKQATGFLEVTNKKITFGNSLAKREISIVPDLKVKVLLERPYTKSAARPGSGSYARSAELFIVKNKKDYRILNFLMEDNRSHETNIIATRIAHFLKEKIKASTRH